MSSQGPWSVKGIDPKARTIARERANKRGVTLGQYLNTLLLDDDAGGSIEDVEVGFSPRESSSDDLRRMSQEIDQLSQRLEASQVRASRSMAGFDKSILGLMGKVDMSSKAQLSALERVSRAMTEIDTTQAALRSRIDTLESDHRGGATVSALKSLEGALARLSGTVQDRLGAVENEQAAFRDLFEEKVGNAVRTSSADINGRVDQIEQQMTAAERRMDGALGRITDAASRFEMFETKAERAVSDTTWRMERALETTLTRSRSMSKELLDRVDGIEEKTREAVNALGDAVTRITDRLSRAERKSETVNHVLERSVSELDDKLSRVGTGAGSEEINRIQALFQKRLDALAEDLSRPIHAVRADVERKLEDALRSNHPEKTDRLERTLRQLQDQFQQAESRQANAFEQMSSHIERFSRAVDDRLRAVEAKDDSRGLEEVRREVLRLADTIDERFATSDKRTASALDEMGGQVSMVAERMQRRQDESVARINHRLDEVASAQQSGLSSADVDKLAERIDERVRDSERRSAEAIGQIGEQVARVADRLQTQHQESLRNLESRLADSNRAHESRLSDVLADMSRRMDEIGEQSANSLAPVHKTISSIAQRVERIEDGSPRTGGAPIPHEAPLDALGDPFIIIDDGGGPVAAEIVAPEPIAETIDVVGVEPPPFDRARDAALFDEEPLPPPAAPVAANAAAEAKPAREIDDLLDMDDMVLDAPAAPAPAALAAEPAQEFFAELPDEPLNRPSHDYLAEARKAARQGRRVVAEPASTGRRGLGKGPLIAASALAVAVAGGGVWTVMRGKQADQAGDDFAKLDPAAPEVAAGDPSAAASVLFSDEPDAASGAAKPADPRNPAAADLFNEPASSTPAKADAKVPPGKTAAAAQKTKTLVDAVNDGDPVALHDYAMELLQTGEKARGVQMMKEAANKGLVMAQYRLANLYDKGEGVPRDMAASRSWTEKAAIGGNLKAMYDLGVLYAEGSGGPQSYAAAAEWFRQAADLGLVDGQYNLALLYEKGVGISEDKKEAAYWYEVASRSGDNDAGRGARRLLGDMPTAQAEQIRRKARGFSPRAAIGRANGDFGKRPWEAASATQISEVQRLLIRLGYSPGSSDGRMGDKTVEAIKAFEMDNDLPTTGEPSANVLRQLRAATLNADG